MIRQTTLKITEILQTHVWRVKIAHPRIMKIGIESASMDTRMNAKIVTITGAWKKLNDNIALSGGIVSIPVRIWSKATNSITLSIPLTEDEYESKSKVSLLKYMPPIIESYNLSLMLFARR